MLNLFCLWSKNGKTTLEDSTSVYNINLLSILSPLLRPTAQEKIPFKILLLFHNALDHPIQEL